MYMIDLPVSCLLTSFKKFGHGKNVDTDFGISFLKKFSCFFFSGTIVRYTVVLDLLSLFQIKVLPCFI